MVGEIFLTALLAVTAENLFFSQGLGFSRLLSAGRHQRMVGTYAGLIGAFSFVSALCGQWLLPVLGKRSYWTPLTYAAVVFIAYVVVLLVLVFGFPAVYKKIGWCLGPAAINSVVFSMPFLSGMHAWSWAQAAGYALGTTVSFWFIASLLAEVMPRLKNMDMPRSFRGVPGVFLYLAILALAFLGFGGASLF